MAPAGGPVRDATWRNRVWLPACRTVGLDGLGFHDLRRANATLVRLGVDVKTAQQRLGHSDVRMTIGLYAQAEKPAAPAAADRLGELFMANSRDGRGMNPADAAQAAEAQASELGFQGVGAPGRTRTYDTRFRKPLLCPLSYGGLATFSLRLRREPTLSLASRALGRRTRHTEARAGATRARSAPRGMRQSEELPVARCSLGPPPRLVTLERAH